jgi:hypothetical protein
MGSRKRRIASSARELRVLAEIIEEELPDRPEILFELHLFLQIFELSQIQFHKYSLWRAAYTCGYFVTPRSDVSMKLIR